MKFFITSSGTEIGKTYVTSSLCREAISAGRSVQALKPIISGFDEAEIENSDSAVLLHSMGRDVTLENIKAITPWQFKAPLSPDMAARQENREIDFQNVVAFCNNSLQQEYDLQLVEGVGGVMVPITHHHTVLDWMIGIKIPAVLVVGSYLGSISHTLTAASVIKKKQHPLKAIVVSETSDSSVPFSETIETLKNFLPGENIFPLPREGKINCILEFLMSKKNV